MDESGIQIVYNSKTGVWEEYDDTYDLIIHCTSAEEAERARYLLAIANQMADPGIWNSASKLPPLHHVTETGEEGPLKYDASEPLLVYTENGRIVANVRYVKSENFCGWDDWSGGLFNTKVTHWMTQPKPPKETTHG